MWINIILNVTLSIITIFIAHHLWEYCKINYTSQKTKNLVEIHASKYKQIAEDMERNMKPDVPANETKNYKIEPTDTIIFLPPNEKEWIHKELTSFIDTL